MKIEAFKKRYPEKILKFKRQSRDYDMIRQWFANNFAIEGRVFPKGYGPNWKEREWGATVHDVYYKILR